MGVLALVESDDGSINFLALLQRPLLAPGGRPRLWMRKARDEMAPNGQKVHKQTRLVRWVAIRVESEGVLGLFSILSLQAGLELGTGWDLKLTSI